MCTYTTLTCNMNSISYYPSSVNSFDEWFDFPTKSPWVYEAEEKNKFTSNMFAANERTKPYTQNILLHSANACNIHQHNLISLWMSVQLVSLTLTLRRISQWLSIVEDGWSIYSVWYTRIHLSFFCVKESLSFETHGNFIVKIWICVWIQLRLLIKPHVLGFLFFSLH